MGNVMKATKAFIYTLAILLAACTDRVDYGTLLMQADSLLTVRPDSALTVLDGIPSKKLKTDAYRAYHALLLTQARDKNYVKQKDDSLILSAIAYYDKVADAKMQARAYYLCRRLRNHTATAIPRQTQSEPRAMPPCRFRQIPEKK